MKVLQYIIKIVIVCVLICVCGVCIQVVLTLRTLPGVITEQSSAWRDMSETVIYRQLAETRTLVHNELESTRQLLIAQSTVIRSDLQTTVKLADTRAAVLIDTSNSQLSAISRLLDVHLTTIESDINQQLVELNTTISTVASPASATLGQIADAAPLFLGCDHNADCVFNRWVGMGRGIEKMAENGAVTSKNISKLTEDIEHFTFELTKPKPWYKHLVDYGKLGVYAVSKFVW